MKIKDVLIEKYKNMNEYPDFEQNCYSKTSKGIYKVGHDSFRLRKWLAFL